MRYCEDIGITADAASRLFVYYGLASCAGRLVSGRLCDFQKVNTFFVYQIAELVAGASILVVTMATSYVHMVVFIVIFGFCDGAYISTLNILCITCTSPQKIAVALGWQMQISSLFTASGPPVAGRSIHTFTLYLKTSFRLAADQQANLTRARVELTETNHTEQVSCLVCLLGVLQFTPAA